VEARSDSIKRGAWCAYLRRPLVNTRQPRKRTSGHPCRHSADTAARREFSRTALDRSPFTFSLLDGRGTRIRTADLQYPKLPRYQAALYPDVPRMMPSIHARAASSKQPKGRASKPYGKRFGPNLLVAPKFFADRRRASAKTGLASRFPGEFRPPSCLWSPARTAPGHTDLA
jgi:hypothetical protein